MVSAYEWNLIALTFPEGNSRRAPGARKLKRTHSVHVPKVQNPVGGTDGKGLLPLPSVLPDASKLPSFAQRILK